MLNKLLFTLCLLVSFNTFSQKSQYQKGGEIKDRLFLIDKNETSTVDEKGNFISVRPHRVNGTLRNYYVEFYKNLDFVERIEIKTHNSTRILKVFILNNKAHIIIKELNKKNIKIKVDLINLNSKNITHKTLLEVNKNNQPNIFSSLKSDNNLTIDYSSNILLSFPVIENKTIYTYVKYFDKELNTLLNDKIFPNKDINNKNVSFLNARQYNNSVYLLYSLSDENKKKYYQLIELNNSKKRELLIPINEGTYELINATISNNNYIISGLYSKKKKGSYLGYTCYNINLNSFEVISSKQSKFLTEKARNYFIGFLKNKRKIDIRNVFIDDHQNIYIIGQLYTIRKEAVPIGIPLASFTVGAASVFITYNPIHIKHKIFDDILVSKINSEGKLIWDNILALSKTEKIKSKSNKRDSSYFTFFENNQVNILMNGYINIEKEKLIVKQNKRKNKTNFYNITVNTHGGIMPNIIFSNSSSEIIFRAEKATKNNKEIYILGQGNMRKQLIKITL